MKKYNMDPSMDKETRIHLGYGSFRRLPYSDIPAWFSVEHITDSHLQIDIAYRAGIIEKNLILK